MLGTTVAMSHHGTVCGSHLHKHFPRIPHTTLVLRDAMQLHDASERHHVAEPLLGLVSVSTQLDAGCTTQGVGYSSGVTPLLHFRFIAGLGYSSGLTPLLHLDRFIAGAGVQ